MKFNNKYLSLITSTNKREIALSGIKPKGRNNVQIEQFSNALKIKKNEVIKFTDIFQSRKTIEDTGYHAIDRIINRQRTISKPFDTQNVNPKFDERRITSTYRKDGKLLSREIEKQNNICLTTEKRITSTYNRDHSVLTQVMSNKNGGSVQKFIQKGKPTRIVTTSPQKTNVFGTEKTVTEKHVYAHLNKSPIRYTEASYQHNELNGENTVKTLRKTIEFKNGLKLQTGTHNGQKILIEIPPKGNGSVLIHKTPEEINQVFARYDDKIKEILS